MAGQRFSEGSTELGMSDQRCSCDEDERRGIVRLSPFSFLLDHTSRLLSFRSVLTLALSSTLMCLFQSNSPLGRTDPTLGSRQLQDGRDQDVRVEGNSLRLASIQPRSQGFGGGESVGREIVPSVDEQPVDEADRESLLLLSVSSSSASRFVLPVADHARSFSISFSSSRLESSRSVHLVVGCSFSQ